MSDRSDKELNDLKQRVVRQVRRLNPGTHDLRLHHAGTRLDARIKVVAQPEGQTPALVANFHGAYTGGRRKPPLFGGFFSEVPGAHQISLADPSVLARPGTRIAWYAGHAGFDTQAAMLALLKGAIIGLGANRQVLVGASGGGFAALCFSHCLPRSVAVVANPQTDILAYSPRLVEEYRKSCWPALAENEQLRAVTRTSMVELYGTGFTNSVVYIQSMGDRTHSQLHMMPFAGATAAQKGARNLLIHSDFDGVAGHVLSREALGQWVRAAVSSSSLQAADLLETWHGLRSETASIASAPAPDKAPSTDSHAAASAASFVSDDLALAARLKDWRAG